MPTIGIVDVGQLVDLIVIKQGHVAVRVGDDGLAAKRSLIADVVIVGRGIPQRVAGLSALVQKAQGATPILLVIP
jgi:hypothetical protein